MIGQRIYPTDNIDNGMRGLVFSEPGMYGKDAEGRWWARPPRGSVGNLSAHEILEHDDGTISVSPSILVEGGANRQTWHGYLIRGEWTEV